MATLNISLPTSMAAFVRAQCDRDCGNVSEYFRTLVREKMKQEIEDDLRFLEATRSRAVAGPSAEEVKEVLALQKRVRLSLIERGIDCPGATGVKARLQ
jgi:Arc/MetJ-type ribon-helix-helix transcriptional regulator